MDMTFAEQQSCASCGSPVRYGSDVCGACGEAQLFESDRSIDVDHDSSAILKRLGYIIEETSSESGLQFRRSKAGDLRTLYTSPELINVVCIETLEFFNKPQSISERQRAARYINLKLPPVKAMYDKSERLDDAIELRIEARVITEGQFVHFVSMAMNWLRWADEEFEKYIA